MTRSTIASAAALALACLGALPCRAQGRLSEKAVVAQTVKSTTITVEYYRPVARGRTLFGDSGVVERGRIWALGANWATTLEVDHDIFVEGKPLPKGRYSLWALVDRDVWTLSFHRTWHLFHMARPDSTDEQLRLTVRPDSAAPTEILTFDFPEIQGGETTLRMRWGRLASFRGSRRARPSLSWWHRLTHPAEHSVLAGRAHYGLRLRVPVQEAITITAPPRAGKTGMLADLVLRFCGPVVATSVKSDIYELTSGIRAQRGPVAVFNPQQVSDLPSTFAWSPVGSHSRMVPSRLPETRARPSGAKATAITSFWWPVSWIFSFGSGPVRS